MSVNVKSSTGKTVLANKTNPYVLPIADSDVLGGIKVGENLSIDENGVLSAEAATTDYEDLTNKPSINSVELSGNKVTSDLGLQDTIPTYTVEEYEEIKDSIPDGTIFNISDDVPVLSAGAGSSPEPYIDVYSTEETLTNKVWIDGNPIYRIVAASFTPSMLETLIMQYETKISGLYIYEYSRESHEIIPLIPVMTSDTTPSGHCTASSVYSSSYPAYFACDEDKTNCWAGQRYNEWWKYEFSGTVVITKIWLASDPSARERIKNFTIQVSNDDTSWTTIYTGVYPRGSEGININIEPQYISNAKYIKVNILDNYSSSWDSDIGEIQCYGYYVE